MANSAEWQAAVCPALRNNHQEIACGTMRTPVTYTVET